MIGLKVSWIYMTIEVHITDTNLYLLLPQATIVVQFFLSVELLADYSSFTITARQLGPNSSVVNGQHLSYGSSAKLKHNDIIEVSEHLSVILLSTPLY